MAAAKKLLKAAAADNEFFAEVWQSQQDFADIVVPFWAGAQTSNAGLGNAHADTLEECFEYNVRGPSGPQALSFFGKSVRLVPKKDRSL